MWPFKTKSDKSPQLVQLFVRFYDGSHLIEMHEFHNYERMRYLLLVTSLVINGKEVKEIQLIKPKLKPKRFKLNWLKRKQQGNHEVQSFNATSVVSG